MENTVIFAIDIEARGQGPLSHGIISIGVCVGSGTEEKVLEKHRFDLKPMPGQKFEQRCWNEFWVHHTDLLGEFRRNAKPTEEQIKAFRELLDRWGDAYILCDNPGFDFGMINFYLDMHGHPTLNYTSDLKYRNTHDADSYGRGVFGQGVDSPWFSNNDACKGLDLDPSSHDHSPENDAEFIYRLHWNMINK